MTDTTSRRQVAKVAKERRTRLRIPAQLYVALVCAAGLAVSAYAVGSEYRHFLDPVAPDIPMAAFALLLIVFAVGVGLAPLKVSYGVTLLVNLAPLFAGVLVLPAALAGIAGSLGTIDRLPSATYPWYRFAFNRGMHLLVFTGAGLTFNAVNSAFTGTAGQLQADIGILAAGVLALGVISVLNPTLVIMAVSAETRQSIRTVADKILRGSVVSFIGLAPLGALMAFLVTVGKVEGIAMSGLMLALLVVYRDISRRAISLQSVVQGNYVAQSRLIDRKDRSTFGHSERVGLLSEAIAVRMRLPSDVVEQIRIGSTLHDIGKIAIADAVLHKTERLTPAEWETMKTHAQEGYDVLKEQESLQRAADIVWTHHENVDGSGYPRGLAGQAIPVGGRIARVVDSYDCITNVREYRPWVMTPFEALADIEAQVGTWYDPEIVVVFEDVLRQQNPEIRRYFEARQASQDEGMLAALRFGPLARLAAAAGLSNFGDMLTTTGLALAAYGASHSTVALGAVVVARALPNLLFGLVAGQLVDRYDRKAVMILTDIARLALVAAIPVLLTAPLPVILVVAFLMSSATVLFNPARSATLPDLVPGRILKASNSLLALVERGTEIAGYAAAAMIIVFGGLAMLFAIDAVTFALSAAIIMTVAFPVMVAADGVGWRSARLRLEVLAGLARIWSAPQLRAIFIFSFLMVAAGSAIMPLMVPLSVEHLHAGNFGFAVCEAAIAVGAALGALLTGVLHVPRRGLLMIVGATGMGAANILAGLSPVLPLTAAFFVIGGIANMVYLVPMITAIQELTPSAVRGRVFAARFTLMQIGVLVGAIYATVATAGIVPRSSVELAVVGTGLVMVAVAGWAAWRSPIRHL